MALRGLKIDLKNKKFFSGNPVLSKSNKTDINSGLHHVFLNLIFLYSVNQSLGS